MIYNAAGVKYSTLYNATITSVTKTGNVLNIKFSANTPLIVAPQVTVSFYGWDSKDYLVSSHTRDANGVRMEKTIKSANALFTEVLSGPTNFEVTLDLAAYQPDPLLIDTIPALIAAGKIKKAEIAVLPTLVIGGTTVALDAVSKTVNVSADGVDQFVSNYFQGTNAIVSEANCNKCHDALATTFHSANRGGSIVVCRTCHVTTNGGSHLEMASRSIDSYVHAIHSFQAFDSGDVDFTNPVEAARYALHIEHTTPIFSLKACEACHLEGTFNVPDQSKSMPGLLSKADTWNVDRAIGSVPEYVTGPASRACGGCHRAELINEDNAGYLAAFNQHTNAGGYLVVNDDDPAGELSDEVLYGIIDKVMTWFE